MPTKWRGEGEEGGEGGEGGGGEGDWIGRWVMPTKWRHLISDGATMHHCRLPADPLTTAH